MRLMGSTTIGAHRPGLDMPGRLYIQRYALLGAVASGMATTAALVYLVATPARPNRHLLDVCLTTAILLSVLVALFVGRVAGTRWERFFFYAWSAATLLLICVSAQLDGGAGSPLSWLLILPVVYASINYPVTQTTLVALAALAGALGLMLTGNAWGAEEWFRVLFVVTFDVMAIASAVNRRSYEIAERQLTMMATHDGLTGCLNNAAFHDRLQAEEARSRRTGRPFSLAMSDCDDFKKINDSRGHEAGDETLQAIANALQRGARTIDAVGRMGGDEFAILLPETASAEAVAMGHRLRTTLHRMPSAVPLTLSFGVATWLGGKDTATATLRRADDAMYEAKRLGGDRLVVWQQMRPGLPGGVAVTS
jgi:diguanylate cyclase (GGDEF)-like protein